MFIQKIIPVALCLLLSGCFGPRDIDFNEVWTEQGDDLKWLILKIKEGGFKSGNNEFPKRFEYPFDQGFFIRSDGSGISTPVDTNKLTIEFYTDRELMDHFSAFIYTNDSSEILRLDLQTQSHDDDQDVKLEANWYYIND